MKVLTQVAALSLFAFVATGCTVFGHGEAAAKCGKDSEGVGCASMQTVMELTDSDAYRENIREYRENTFGTDGSGKSGASAANSASASTHNRKRCSTFANGVRHCTGGDESMIGTPATAKIDRPIVAVASFASSGNIRPREAIGVWVAPYVDMNGFYNKSSVIEVEIQLDPNEVWGTDNVIQESQSVFQPLKL